LSRGGGIKRGESLRSQQSRCLSGRGRLIRVKFIKRGTIFGLITLFYLILILGLYAASIRIHRCDLHVHCRRIDSLSINDSEKHVFTTQSIFEPSLDNSLTLQRCLLCQLNGGAVRGWIPECVSFTGCTHHSNITDKRPSDSPSPHLFVLLWCGTRTIYHRLATSTLRRFIPFFIIRRSFANNHTYY
jgi:hypothetical protein